MKPNLLLAMALPFIAWESQAKTKTPIVPPQPTTCITSAFSSTGSKFWQTISLKITNNCNQTVDFQNSTIIFSDASNLNNLSFWGNFLPLSYPINALQINSQPQSDGSFLASLPLVFSTDSSGNSKLPKGSSFTINYGAPAADYLADSTLVYLSSSVMTGNISLLNSTAKPQNITQGYTLVNIIANGQTVSTAEVPWSGQQVVSGLAAAAYTISPVNISDSNGNIYQGTANPASINLTSGETVSSTLIYNTAQLLGLINLNLEVLPSQLSGYTLTPIISLTRTDTGSSTTKNVQWGTTTSISQLANNVSYNFLTPSISYNGYKCTPSFVPSAAIANSTKAPTVNLSYSCIQVAQDNVNVKVTGAPQSTTSINVSFTPNGSGTVIHETIPLANGSGSGSVQLTDGTLYTVNADAISGYTASYSPQPLTAAVNASETISYGVNTGGRIIGYLPGWKTPPSAAAIASAGYTHVLVAFGVFSTDSPGQITSAFGTITADYIKSLQKAGIKVLLSIGGASTSIANTTINFDQVVSAAPSPAIFAQTFVSSLENLVTEFGFDGFDFDIESGLNGGGTFAKPTGDIAILASIINTLHTNNPSLLLSLAPQIANVAATSGYDATWGNYASLIMQTHQSLTWVGIQIYNSGCADGIDLVCYDPNNSSSPNASVAFATDLLTNWPSQTNTGQKTGFQPYLSYLTPSQVVLGYPAPNSAGVSDGAPAAVISTIKRAIQCLRTAVAGPNSCDSYVPPKAYPGIGGVFEWELNYDASNNYQFAKNLKACVINGNCN